LLAVGFRLQIFMTEALGDDHVGAMPGRPLDVERVLSSLDARNSGVLRQPPWFPVWIRASHVADSLMCALAIRFVDAANANDRRHVDPHSKQAGSGSRSSSGS